MDLPPRLRGAPLSAGRYPPTSDYDFDPRGVSKVCRVGREANEYRIGLPHDVVDIAGCHCPEVFSSITAEGLGPCLADEGSMMREVFDTYLEHVQVPILGPGQVVVMDNPSAHRGAGVRKIV